jgi:hypothetical protein
MVVDSAGEASNLQLDSEESCKMKQQRKSKQAKDERALGCKRVASRLLGFI